MTDYEDAGSAKLAEIRRRRRRAAWLKSAAVTTVLVGAGLAVLNWGWIRARLNDASRVSVSERPGPREAFAPAPAEPTPRPAPPRAAPAPPVPLPALDESDAFVRERAAAASSRAELAAWLLGGDLLRRFAATVDNVADGHSPHKHIGELRPRDGFRVVEREGRLLVDPRSYERYDLVANVFASLDAQACARLYGQLSPLIQKAYADLGYPERRFDDTLARAFAVLLRTPVRDGELEVSPGLISYRLADPELEGLSGAQKQLLRMGPRNVRKVHAKLRELAAALDLGERVRAAGADPRRAS